MPGDNAGHCYLEVIMEGLMQECVCKCLNRPGLEPEDVSVEHVADAITIYSDQGKLAPIQWIKYVTAAERFKGILRGYGVHIGGDTTLTELREEVEGYEVAEIKTPCRNGTVSIKRVSFNQGRSI